MTAASLTASKNRREAEREAAKFLIWDTKIVGVNIGRRLVTAAPPSLNYTGSTAGAGQEIRQ